MTTSAVRRKLSIQMPAESPLSFLIRAILILVFDAGAVWFAYNAYLRGFTQLVIIVSVITVMLNLIFLIPGAYPFRWLAIGLSLLILFVIYPIFFTLYIAFTNYGDGVPSSNS
jgi:hypothetical protein